MKSRYITAIVCLAWVCAHAGGPATSQKSNSGGHVYLIAKALEGTGSTVNGLSGESINGGALDLGYKPPNWKHLSLELNTAYAEGTGVPRPDKKKASAEEALTFRGLGLNLAYTHHFKGFSLVGKGGVKYERERAEEPGHSPKTIEETGFAYAAGIEFPLPGNLELAVEIEGVTFDSPKGMDLLLGLKVPLR